MIAAVQCAGKGPSHVREASAAVGERIQQFEADSRLVRSPEHPKPLPLEWHDVKIDTLLGTGSFSCVYKAKVTALDSSDNKKQMYAMKKLSTETICCNQSFVTGATDLAIEAKILSNLHHENVIQIRGVKGGSLAESFSHSQMGGGFFIIMDLLEETLDSRLEQWRMENAKGISFKDLFSRKKRATKRLNAIAERMDSCVTGIARGMEYIHSKNIILRDLKPHNIGFDKKKKVKIFDFGLARELAQGRDSSGNIPRCNTGVAGTLRYISPENALGKPCGLPCDVYSFAILIYEVITLQVPFADIKLVTDFKEKVIRGTHRPNLKFVPSALLQDLLRDSWHPDPSKRPSFAEIQCILEELLAENLLTKKGEWKKFFYRPTHPSSVPQTGMCCSFNSNASSHCHINDGSVGGGSVRRLSGSHHQNHLHSAKGTCEMVVDLKFLQAEAEHNNHKEGWDAQRRASMAGSFHGGLDDQTRSFNENISFNSGTTTSACHSMEKQKALSLINSIARKPGTSQ